MMPQHDVQHATTFLTDQVYSFSLVDDKRGEKSISLDLDNYSGEQLEHRNTGQNQPALNISPGLHVQHEFHP